jgi:hypothetical protein
MIEIIGRKEEGFLMAFWLKCIDNCLLRVMKNALAMNSLSKDLLFERESKVNMVTLNKMDKIMGIKNISKKIESAKAIGAYALGARAIGAGATGAFALGCIAIGSIAIGAFYLGRLSVKKASFGDMRIGKLTIEDLEIINSKINVDGCADGKEI